MLFYGGFSELHVQGGSYLYTDKYVGCKIVLPSMTWPVGMFNCIFDSLPAFACTYSFMEDVFVPAYSMNNS